MRIDKFLSETGTMTRKESGKAVRSGRLSVNGEIVKAPDRHIDPEKDVIALDGAVIGYKKFTYIIMNTSRTKSNPETKSHQRGISDKFILIALLRLHQRLDSLLADGLGRVQ